MAQTKNMAGRGGFTLMELLVALAVMSVLMGIIGARGIEMIGRYQLSIATEQIAADIKRTRLEALRLNTPVTFQRLDDSTYQVGTIPARRLYGGARFTAASPNTAQFSSVGRLVGAATEFGVQRNGTLKRIRIATGGMVMVQ